MVLRLLVAIILGANFGALSALWFGGMISGGPKLGKSIEIAGWHGDWSIGSESANPYVRARVARNGLLALRREEAVYFIKNEDSDGDRLRETCTYQVSGGTYPALWWSITLYDGANRLPMNEDERLSFDQTMAETLSGADARSWAFQVSPTPPSDPNTAWVSSKSSQTFDLMLRLYKPAADLLQDPESVLTPPTIERIHCAEGGS